MVRTRAAARGGVAPPLVIADEVAASVVNDAQLAAKTGHPRPTNGPPGQPTGHSRLRAPGIPASMRAWAFGMRLAPLSRAVPPPSDDIDDRLRRNLARVDNLVAVYEERARARPGRSGVLDGDLLRAAIVFLHATLEDAVRSVLTACWPLATDAELFRRVPFVLPDGHRPEKLSVGELAQHLRAKTVAEVVTDAVEGVLARASFNDIDDLVLALRRAGIDPALLDPHAAVVYVVMQRRHWVVHRADRNIRSGRGHHEARSVRLADFRRWRVHVEALCRAIIASV